ncbi:disulfide-isomerase A6 [Paramuricea clavata]|uniref:protein disulfide-isomerase n=1 Tax=Paramuricea clavata TaxID=317549 RepID=A0A7D9JGW2_PARCT|nr:disulfide-isomerase A6 [Paramuricea clavata]
MFFIINCVTVLCSVVLTEALYGSSSDVVELTAGNFDGKVIQSDDIWLVEFYAPWCGHCQSLAPEWKKAATALKGIIKVGAVDMDVHSSVGGPYNVRGFPTIKIFGANKNSPVDYNGPRTAPGLTKAALEAAQSAVNQRLSGGGGSRSSGGGKTGGGGGSGGSGNAKDVIELTDSNFEEKVLQSNELWLVEFFAPWCGHCQRLEPEWKKAATELKGKMNLGALEPLFTRQWHNATVYKVFLPLNTLHQGASLSTTKAGEALRIYPIWPVQGV